MPSLPRDSQDGAPSSSTMLEPDLSEPPTSRPLPVSISEQRQTAKEVMATEFARTIDGHPLLLLVLLLDPAVRQLLDLLEFGHDAVVDLHDERFDVGQASLSYMERR